MARAGAECHHVNHVNTQLPYVLLVAAVSFISYLVAGFTRSAIISLFVGAILVVASLFFLKKKSKA